MIAGGSRTGADRLRRDRRKERYCRARASGRATPDLHRKPDKHPSASLQRDLHSGAGRGSLLDADNIPKRGPFCTPVDREALSNGLRWLTKAGMPTEIPELTIPHPVLVSGRRELGRDRCGTEGRSRARSHAVRGVSVAWTCNGFVPVPDLTMPPWLRMRAG